jgi:hypothetical protein
MIETARDEARELLNRYNVNEVYIVKHDRVIHPTWHNDEPGFEALLGSELRGFPHIVEVVNK